MKHILLLALSFSAIVLNVEAQTLSYRAINQSEAEVTKCTGGVRVEVPTSTQINGQTYRVVSIGSYAFCNNRTLQYVTLPPTLRKIGEKAFAQCSSLKEITIPNSVTWVGRTAFAGCTSLVTVTLPTNAQYDLEGRFKTFQGCQSIAVINGHADERLFEAECAAGSFSSYAEPRIQAMVAQWQLKDEFETSTEWRARVTQENRQAQARKFTAEVRREFIEANKRAITNQTIGSYDADNGVFPVTVKSGDTDMGIIYVSVPSKDEAKDFKQKFASVKLSPEYGIVNDKVGIVACTFTLNGKTYQNAKSYTAQDNSNDLTISLPPLEINFDDTEASQQGSAVAVIDNSVDVDIPRNIADNNSTYALIIGNENYSRVENVAFAKNDAQVFAKYCTTTLGLPDKNVNVVINATYGNIMSAISWLKDIAKAYHGDVKIIFYYAGHGIPDEATRSAYLLPVDADGSQTDKVCLALSELYSELNSMQARQVLVFMDACFSGARRGTGMLASARGVALRVNAERPQGNMVVFSAATGDQSAYPYDEKQHGMFTYFLLKKLQDNRGNVTLGELADYITENVTQQSVVNKKNGRKQQTPTVVPADAVAGNWRVSNIK